MMVFKIMDRIIYWIECITGYAVDFEPLRLVKVEEK